jgi:diguanylate cyclase (GGDEF)-like protein
LSRGRNSLLDDRSRLLQMRWRKQAEAVRASGRRALAAALLVLVVLTPIVAAVASGLGRSSDRVARGDFDQTANQAATGIQTELNGYFGELADIGAFVAVSHNPSRAEFSEFLKRTQVAQRFPQLAGVFYADIVPRADLDRYLAEVHTVQPDFAFTDGGLPVVGDDHYVVTQFEATSRDMLMLVGFDAATIDSVRTLTGRMAETGDAQALAIQQDPTVKSINEAMGEAVKNSMLRVDLFVATGVFDPVEPGQVGPGRLRGIVTAPLTTFDELFAGVTRDQPTDLGISLELDLSGSGLNRPDLLRNSEREGSAGPLRDASFSQSRDFSTRGVQWRLTMWSGPDAASGTGVRNLVGAAGMLLVLAFVALVYHRMRASANLTAQARLQHDIVASVTDAMVVLDHRGVIVAANPAFASLRGPDPGGGAGPAGRSYLGAILPRVSTSGDDLARAMTEVLGRASGVRALDILFRPGDGEPARWYAVRVIPLAGSRHGAVVVHSDVTERRRTQDAFEFRANHDALTGLENRAALDVHLDHALARAGEDRTPVAVLFLDLDGFKAVNDTHGHALGDKLLVAVAHRLRLAVRGGDRLGRVGGDEFVALARVDDAGEARRIAGRMADSLLEPLRIDGLVLEVRASVGIALSQPEETAAQLLQRADRSMYRVKQLGGGYDDAPHAGRGYNEVADADADADAGPGCVAGTEREVAGEPAEPRDPATLG